MEEDKVNYKSEYLKVVEANDKMKCEIVELRIEIKTPRNENDILRIENEWLRGDANECFSNSPQASKL